jgi:DNA-directed RNA polymerase specialized sigma24 family protein
MALDTTMGGAQSQFPSTSFTLVRAAGTCREHLERLASLYWKPIYSFVRRAWSKSDADAKDLTQSFLMHLLQGDLLLRFDTARGNFRSYLKQCLRNFLAADARDAGRLKRGGDATQVPLEGAALAGLAAPEEGEFDRDWSQEVLTRALRETELAFRADGKGVWFDVFRSYALDAAEPPAYAEVARRHGISAVDVGNHLRFVRRDLRLRVLRIVSEYVADEQDALQEAARIIGEPA